MKIKKALPIIFMVIPFVWACENAQVKDNDRDLIDEEKVKIKYQEVKDNLKEAGNKINEETQEIKEEIKEETQ